MSNQVKEINAIKIIKRLIENKDIETLEYIKKLHDDCEKWEEIANISINEIKRRSGI